MTVHRLKPTDKLVTTEQWKLWPLIKDGDVVELEGGIYGFTQFFNVPRVGVVVRPAAGAAVMFQTDRGYLSIQKSPGWTFSGDITFQQVVVGESDDVQFLGVKLTGGLGLVNSKRVVVDGAALTGKGISYKSDCPGLRVRKITCRGLASDGVSGVASDVIIEDTDMSDFVGETALHADAIQVMMISLNGNKHPTGIIIRNNRIRRGAGLPVQAIFLQCGDGTQVYGNQVVTGNYHGITNNGINGDIHDNYVQGIVGALNPARYTEAIGFGYSEIAARAYAQMTPYPVGGTNNVQPPNTADGDFEQANAWWAANIGDAPVGSPPAPVEALPATAPAPVAEAPPPLVPSLDLVEVRKKLEKARAEMNALKNGAARGVYALDAAIKATG